MYKKSQYKKNLVGFTLLEVLLSVSIIALIAVFSTPIYQVFQQKNDLDITTNEVVQIIRRSQALSKAVDSDSAWGVHFQNNSLIIFKGNTYSSRDTAFDDVYDISANISQSGLSEIVFSKLHGEAQATGDITLTSTNNETRTITINKKGIEIY